MSAAMKTVIVTGASRGIGLAIAQYLLRDKSHQLVLSARSVSQLQVLQKEAPELVEVVSVDMADIGAGKLVVDKALERFGKVDGLVVNHGILDPVAKVADGAVLDWKVGFDINFFSAIELIQTALPSLRETKGRIVVTSSGAANSAYQGWGAYGASKAALNHLVATLGVEEPDVTAIAIRPGTVNTEMQREIREVHNSNMSVKDNEKFSELFTSDKLLKPEQPGYVIAKLSVNAPNDLSGKFLTWNDNLLQAFQEA